MRRMILALLCLTTPATAQITNFSRDVASSIDLGLGWLDRAGAFNANSSCGNAAGLCALALLEKRQSADVRAAPQGYQNAAAADRQRMDRIMGFIIAICRHKEWIAPESTSCPGLSRGSRARCGTPLSSAPRSC